jgi:hypothetical protein
MISKRGCSFKNENWGIVEWPTLTTTKAALERRAKEAAAKRKGTSSGVKPKGTTNPSAGAQREVFVALEPVMQETPIPSIPSRPRGRGDSTLIQSSASSSSRAPAPLIENPSLPTRTLAGKNQSVFMENLLPYQDILSDPNRTPLSLKLQAIELDAICSREKVEAQFLMDMIEGRASVIDTMISSIETEASRLENGESEDDSESHCDVEEDEEDVDREEEEREMGPPVLRSRRR